MAWLGFNELVELRAVRPLVAAVHWPDTAQVRNLDKQAARLQSPSAVAR